MTTETVDELECINYEWAYKPINSGYEIVYIKDGKVCYFLEGDDDAGIHTNEEIVKHIVELHNARFEVI